ncbi:MAG: hypothetical protein ACYC6W_04255 [Nitrosotalea sp.]
MKNLNDMQFQDNVVNLLADYDLFLCSAGFEDRTVSALERTVDIVRIKKSLINLYRVDDDELFSRNKDHADKINHLLSGINANPKILETKPNDPSEFMFELENTLLKSKNVLIDITSFTRLFLYSVLDLCERYNVKSHILYSEPLEYTMNFSQGLESIIIMPTNPGVPDQSKKILMVLFLGWESRRLGSVVEEWEPDKLITIAEFSNNETREYWNEVTMKQCEELVVKSEHFRVPALKPRETLAKLEEIFAKYQNEYDICLVNGGPKIQCLALSEFAFKHPEVQLLYAKPYRWKQELPSSDSTKPISKGTGVTYVFSYPLNAFLEPQMEIT